jgi:YVTN family beta-propeller protein
MIYVSNLSDNTVSVINSSTYIVSATIAVGNGPEGLSVSPDGTKLYLANNSDNNVYVINTSTNAVVDTIAVGNYPQAMGNFISSYIQTSGIPTLSFESDGITIYPNPANTILNIHSQSGIRNYELRIMDVMGNEVYHQSSNSQLSILNSQLLSVDISSLSNGVYFYQLTTDKGIVGKGKFVVIK